MRKSSSLIRLASALLVITAHYSLMAKAAAPVELQTYDVGSLAGQLSVEQGTASYRLPISVPPGVAGVTPELALSYSSLNGGGVMGPGWALDGLSTIARCGRTLEQDGSKVSIEWQQTDRYCLDGQRLILVAGTHGTDGSEYRTETDGIARIRAHGQAGQGPAWFSVQTKAGQTIEYGNTADSRIEAHGRAEALAWAQNRITDAVGNFIDYVYQEETAHTEYRIASIAYTGNGAIAPTNEVRFTYTDLPSGEIKPQYIVGVTTKLTKQLSTVETYADGVKVSDYNLSYLVRQDKPDLLEKVQLCEGSGLCQSPVRFAWQQAGSPNAFASYATWRSSGYPRASVEDPFDYNGGTMRVAKAMHTLDVNGDGLQDLVIESQRTAYQDGPSALSIWLSNGTSFQPWTGGSSGSNQNAIGIGDVNGDGKADFIKALSSGTVQVALQGAGGFGAYTTWRSSGYPVVRIEDPSPFNYYGDRISVAKAMRLLDVNGDGFQDLLIESGQTVYGDGPSNLTVWLSTGSAFQPWTSFSSGSRQNAIGMGDVNGDGRADLVKALSTGAVQVALNGSSGFGAYTTWRSSGYPVARIEDPSPFNYHGSRISVAKAMRFVDVNGDGLQDLLGESGQKAYPDGPSGLSVWISKGISFEPWSGFSSGSNRNAIDMGDVNGDGQADLIKAMGTDYQSGAVQVSLANVSESDLMVGITDALGNPLNIAYGKSTDGALHQPAGTQVYPLNNVRSPIPLVKSVEKGNGLGGTVKTSYRYGGAKAHVKGRGFLGFAWDEATDESTGVTTRTEYRQDFPYVGMPSVVTTRTAGGTVLSSSVSTYANQTTGYVETRPGGSTWNYSTHFPYLLEKVEQSFELDGSLVSTVTTRQSGYDAYGNVGQVEVITSAGGETYSKVTTNTYDNIVDVNKWHLGRLREATVLHTHHNGSTETRKSAFNYDPVTGLLVDEIIEPDQPAYRQLTTYEYDAFGNKVKTHVGADGLTTRTTTSGYDPSGRFATSVQNALGHSESRTFDPATGKALSLTGPNGLMTQWEYDGWGRVTRELRADGTDTTTHRAWVDGADPNAPTAAYYQVTTQTSGSAPTTNYYDQLGRVIRKRSTGFDGRAIYQDTEYDAQGREARSSLPYFKDGPSYWVVNHYDAVNRVIQKTFDTGKGTVTTDISYQGLTTVETNTLGQVKRTTKNALGKVALVEEAEGGKLTYEYDAIGNLLRTHQHDDANAKVVTTELWYDVRGRKTAMQDPSMGYWTYDHNAFGELTSQTDAKGQTTQMHYDALGRMTSRTEPEGQTVWTYDTATQGIGKLHKVEQFDSQSTLIYAQTHSYDSLGRDSSNVTSFDGKTFNTSVDYDANSRVAKTWGANGFETENLYNIHGYLVAKRSPASQINDYDAAHLASLYDEATASAQAALDAAAGLITKRDYFAAQAAHYQSLGDTGITLPPALITELQAAAQASHQAAMLLDSQIDNALALAEQLIVVAGSLADRLEQTELWVEASGADTLDAMLADPTSITWWRATSRDAAGRLTGHRTGNGLVTIQDYDRATGQLNSIQSGFGYGTLVRQLDYVYDGLDNVLARHDAVQGVSETFSYDQLNRLTTSRVSGTLDGVPYEATTSYAYDALGNLTYKSDIGSYLYGDAAKTTGNAGPHALHRAGSDDYVYDANGSITSGGGRTVTWSSFNKPTSFQKGDTVIQFHYGPDRKRYKKTVGGQIGTDETTLYLGKSYERIEKAGGEVSHKHFIYAEGQLAAIHIEHEDPQGVIDPSRDETRYLHRDALGSIDTITDGQGVIVERMGYSPYGQRRQGDWRTIGGLNLALYTNRGFTGHEHIDEVGLIHMNGRVYDPQLGRFLSADPFVQSPTNSQSYNRYSYAWNNPLKYTDPSGYFLKKLFKGIRKALNALFKLNRKIFRTIFKYTGSQAILKFLAGNEIAYAIAQIAATIILPGVGNALLSAAVTYAATGDGWAALRAGAIAYASAYAFDVVGHGLGLPEAPSFLSPDHIVKTIAHGVVGGIRSELMGGKFSHGFAAAGVGQLFAPGINKIGGGAANYKGHRIAAAAIVGGTASVLGGGKFANGAVTAAFGRAFNDEALIQQSICKGACHGYDSTPGREMTTEEELILNGATVLIPGGGAVGAIRTIRSLWSVKRATSTFGKAVESLKVQQTTGNGQWVKGTTTIEPSKYKSPGLSVETGWGNLSTGQRVYQHRIHSQGRVYHTDSFRPYPKSGAEAPW